MINNPPQKLARSALRVLLCAVLLAPCLHVSATRAERIHLFPRFHAGQVLSYQISYHNDKEVHTQGSVIVASPSDHAKVDVRGLLRLEILRIDPVGQRAVIQARGRFETLNSDSHLKTPNLKSPAAPAQHPDPQGKSVDFVILPDGRINAVKGLDDLVPEQQQAWQEWAARFTLAAAFPGRDRKSVV